MNRTEHLLVCLAEECAEVGQAASKALRFGLTDQPPGGGLRNNEYIVRELNDVLAIVEMLGEHGVELIGMFDRVAIDAKKAKVKNYMFYAESRGTLK